VRLALVVAVLLALAPRAEAMSLAHGRWVDAVRSTYPTAADVVARMRAAYTNLSTYRDGGQIRFHTPTRAPTRREEVAHGLPPNIGFSTAFVRATGQFVFRAGHSESLRQMYGPLRREPAAWWPAIVWLEAGRAFVARASTRLDSREVDVHSDTSSALRAARAWSNGVAAVVPALLLDQEALIDALFSGATIDGRESVETRPCWLLRTTRNGIDTTYYVDAERYLIRHLTIEWTQDDVPVRQDVTYIVTTEATPHADQLKLPRLREAHVPDGTITKRPWIGILFGDGLTRVARVVPGSSAALVGIQEGDRVIAVGKIPVSTTDDVDDRLAAYARGSTVDLTVERGRTTTTYSATVSARPSPAEVQRAFLIDRKLAPLSLASVRLSGRRDRPLVIVYWASWCKECVAALPQIKAWELAHRNKVTLVGITDEFSDAAKASAREHAIPFPLLVDDDHAAWRALLMQGLPTTVVIDRDGIVRDVSMTFDPGELTKAIGR
jgi:peroxiredoxin